MQWKPEDKILLNQLHSGKTFEEIARIQKQSVGRIESRLKTIAARLYFKDNLSYEKVEEITGIKKNKLIIKRCQKLSEMTGMPKIEAESEPKSSVAPIQIITTENPFSLDAISTLLTLSLSRSLFTTTSIS